MTLRSHDSELANIVDALPGDGGAKHPCGEVGVVGAAQDDPGCADRGKTQDTGGNLSSDAGADEGTGEGVVLAAALLNEHAGGDAIGGNLGGKGGKLDLGLPASAAGSVGKSFLLYERSGPGE
ncbi:MAG TPA: hypothetical protein VKQ11_10590 [Candidatus Sulfotelmatobacter sp.]|nr:hypothetical protein [Candidatus Sulfotelmatobacter sp.]